jgi:hypothetical protein
MQLFSLIRLGICASVCLVFSVPQNVNAHVPNLVTQTSLKDITVIHDPELSQAFYGSMNGFPHTYEIRATEPFHLFTQVVLPDVSWNKNNVSGIIIKEQKKGRVLEISRLHAKEATWESWYEPIGGDTYRKGPQFEGDLDPGVYRIEVNTPDNLEKYVLVVGTREEMTIGYFELLKRIFDIKHFFEKSSLHMLESPLVYGPILILFAFVGILVYKRKRQIDQIPQ